MPSREWYYYFAPCYLSHPRPARNLPFVSYNARILVKVCRSCCLLRKTHSKSIECYIFQNSIKVITFGMFITLNYAALFSFQLLLKSDSPESVVFISSYICRQWFQKGHPCNCLLRYLLLSSNALSPIVALWQLLFLEFAGFQRRFDGYCFLISRFPYSQQLCNGECCVSTIDSVVFHFICCFETILLSVIVMHLFLQKGKVNCLRFIHLAQLLSLILKVPF